jgi:hypothetical protein
MYLRVPKAVSFGPNLSLEKKDPSVCSPDRDNVTRIDQSLSQLHGLVNGSTGDGLSRPKPRKRMFSRRS